MDNSMGDPRPEMVFSLLETSLLETYFAYFFLSYFPNFMKSVQNKYASLTTPKFVKQRENLITSITSFAIDVHQNLNITSHNHEDPLITMQYTVY